MDSQKKQLFQLFYNYSDNSNKMIMTLIQDGFRELGEFCMKDYFQQWKVIGKQLNTPNKLNCLNDKNHRTLILKFIKEEAASFYHSSYFNNAKIDHEYIQWFDKIGPYDFSQIITIVNKLKLIQKHHKAKMQTNIIIESHIQCEIRNIMELCTSKKRNINSNLNKFRQIARFQERMQLVRQLGKMLRSSWSVQKKIIKQVQCIVAEQLNKVQPLPMSNNQIVDEPMFELVSGQDDFC